MPNYIELLANPVILIISIVAILSYTVLINLIIFYGNDTNKYLSRVQYWKKALAILVASLPLLGLLGTITGLMETFFALSINSSMDLQSLMSAGIADAMFSTQFGLSLAIPGYILLHVLNVKKKHILLTRYS